jgi:hypothetical protein
LVEVVLAAKTVVAAEALVGIDHLLEVKIAAETLYRSLNYL